MKHIAVYYLTEGNVIRKRLRKVFRKLAILRYLAAITIAIIVWWQLGTIRLPSPIPRKHGH